MDPVFRRSTTKSIQTEIYFITEKAICLSLMRVQMAFSIGRMVSQSQLTMRILVTQKYPAPQAHRQRYWRGAAGSRWGNTPFA